VAREVVEVLVSPGILERPPMAGARYFGFTDPSGGSSDSFTLAVAHKEHEAAILDCVRERRPPFSPEAVVEEFSEVLKSYRLTEVSETSMPGNVWARNSRSSGFSTRRARRRRAGFTWSLALLNSGRLDLLDNERLVNQICSLERRTARGGRDSVDHGVHGRDDLSNVVLGVAHLALTQRWHIPVVW
jgi:hypothetical protein